MFKKKDLTPLIIVVKGTNWEAIGPVTPRSHWLYSVLQSQGGIAESVTDGIYHFNAKRERFKLAVSLTKIED